MMMSRYNNNWGSHDQLQELRKANMALHRELDATKKLLSDTLQDLAQAQDELVLALEALARVRNS
jgi:hypothetical protein